jgi:photosystem II stability/assembly factor-like uncharacterized protein
LSPNGDGLIYTSSDAGGTWAPSFELPNFWSCVASSADGTHLVAAASLNLPAGGGATIGGDGLLYTSTNSGASWAQSGAPNDNWISVASSADGNKVVAASRVCAFGTNLVGGVIYRSADSGQTWSRTIAPTADWLSVASSTDGVKLLALAEQLYASVDSGVSWKPIPAPTNGFATLPRTFLKAFALSADGTKLAASWADSSCTFISGNGFDNGFASFERGQVYLSADSGATWTVTGPPSAGWSSLAMSADGYRVVAASSGWQVCLLPYSGPWRSTGASNSYYFNAVASSADGRKLVASDGNIHIYTSSDSGTNWSPTSAPTNNWTFLASSSDGTKLLAAPYVGQLYVSSNSGVGWTAAAPSNYWSSVASSAEGTKLAAASSSDLSGSNLTGRIYISGDSGADWEPTSAPADVWTSIASSADGSRLVAVAAETLPSTSATGSGRIHLSADSGVSWKLTSAPSNNWVRVASSADGNKLVAVASNGAGGDGLIYTSYDSGISWSRAAVPTNNWFSVTSSADGTRLVALGDGGPYISTDSGATWNFVESPAGAYWSAVASSADGNSVVAVGGPISILRWPLPPVPAPPSPRLSVDRSGTQVGLSWLLPSTRFVLQQSFDLTSSNWVDVTNQPTFNFTNLHNQLTLPKVPARAFYRLRQR